MKLEEKTGFIKSSENFQKKEFTIAASAQAFQVLSSQLYTNKARAIIRELSCNAVDAMKMANTLDTKKFIVQLPTKLDPTFRIRDFGTGISPEDIDRVYTEYFSSTKRDSNEQIGCLGLGSKTPFCYTDNFQVHSYINGVKYSYAAVIDENQMPQIMKVGQSPTTEENGLEVIMAIKANDFMVWAYEANNTYVWFKHLPEIKGNVISIPRIEKENIFLEKNEGNWSWKLVSEYPEKVANSFNGAQVLMGGVCYKLDQSIFQNATKEIAALSDINLIIEVPIGEVTPAANRETLHLDNKSKLSLKEKLLTISRSIVGLLCKEIENQPTYWHAVDYWTNLVNRLSWQMKELIDNSSFVPKFKGRELKRDIEFEFPIRTFTSGYDAYYKKVTYEEFVWRPKHWRFHLSEKKKRPIIVYKSKTSDRDEINFVKYIDSTSSTFGSTETFLLIDEEDCNLSFEALLEMIGCPKENLLKIEDLPNSEIKEDEITQEEEPTKEKKKQKKKDEAYLYIYPSNNSGNQIPSNVTTVDLENGNGIYFECKFRKPYIKNEISIRQLNKAISLLAQLLDKKETDFSFYGFTETQIKKVKENKKTKWVNLFDVIKENLEKLYQKDEAKFYFSNANYSILSNRKNIHNLKDSRMIQDICKKIDANHELNKLINEAKDISKILEMSKQGNKSKFDEIFATKIDDEVFRQMNVESPWSIKDKSEKEMLEKTNEFISRVDSLWSKYPILELAHQMNSGRLPVNQICEIVSKNI